MSFDRKAYFERIRYTDQPDVSVKTFIDIHTAQVFSIPFENLAIHELKNTKSMDDYIHLDEASLVKKLIIDKRGGYCHELNELLAIALTDLGFKVERLAARVLTGPNLPRGHKLLLVTIDNQKWIADVGFGGYGLLNPIPLVLDQKNSQFGDDFQIISKNNKYVLQFLQNANWKDLYEFNLEIFNAIDFKPMNYYISHSPDSFFVKNRFCVMPTPKGRIILFNEKLKIMNNSKEEVKIIQNEENYSFALKEMFGITLSETIVLKKMESMNSKNNKAENPSQTKQWFNHFTHPAITTNTTGTNKQPIQSPNLFND